jgi:hypothetical protein
LRGGNNIKPLALLSTRSPTTLERGKDGAYFFNKMKKNTGKLVTVQKTWLSTKEALQFFGMTSYEFLERLRNEALVTFSEIPGSKGYYYELRSLERLLEKNIVVKQHL